MTPTRPAKNGFTFSGAAAPAPLELLNLASRCGGRRFNQWASLNDQDLLDIASRKTRLSDWGEPDFQPALSAMLDAVVHQGRLTPWGRITLRAFLLQSLTARLRIVDMLKRYPQIAETEIQRPIFIVGWYRTGTTLLHNLLATHPQLRAPLFWELRDPCSLSSPRRAAARRAVRHARWTHRIHRYLSPGFETAHAIDAEKPEECVYLFDNACVSPMTFFTSEAKDFAWWLLANDISQAYRFYRSQLQLLSWARPGQRWLLKWPYHLWHLDALLETFPDAQIIHMHRDPVESLPSVCSLAALARSAFCETVDRAALGRFWLRYYDAGLQRGLQARGLASQQQFSDVRFSELVRDPLQVIERLQKPTGLTLTDEWAGVLRTHLAQNPRHRFGVHKYGLSQFGLGIDEIHERFAGYTASYGMVEEPVKNVLSTRYRAAS
ncbi:MAG: sulfotransferase [Gammaproteobacteria bacterium]|nr:MAG: sulfotransferase [Gammaproteobacteria bacterium]